jgi:hypothetical protein
MASFHSNERIPPSNRGIKQLAARGRLPDAGGRYERAVNEIMDTEDRSGSETILRFAKIDELMPSSYKFNTI